MYIRKRTMKILDVLSKKLNKKKGKLLDDSVKIFCFLYGQFQIENNDIIFRDKNNNERKLKFDDFIN